MKVLLKSKQGKPEGGAFIAGGLIIGCICWFTLQVDGPITGGGGIFSGSLR